MALQVCGQANTGLAVLRYIQRRLCDCHALMTIYRSNTMRATSIGHRRLGARGSLARRAPEHICCLTSPHKAVLKSRQCFAAAPCLSSRITGRFAHFAPRFCRLSGRSLDVSPGRVRSRVRRAGRRMGAPTDRRHNAWPALITFSLIVTDTSAGFC